MICTSIATHGIANSFVIVQTGNLKFRLYYMLQSYFFVGLIISALSILVITIASIVSSRVNVSSKLSK